MTAGSAATLRWAASLSASTPRPNKPLPDLRQPGPHVVVPAHEPTAAPSCRTAARAPRRGSPAGPPPHTAGARPRRRARRRRRRTAAETPGRSRRRGAVPLASTAMRSPRPAPDGPKDRATAAVASEHPLATTTTSSSPGAAVRSAGRVSRPSTASSSWAGTTMLAATVRAPSPVPPASAGAGLSRGLMAISAPTTSRQRAPGRPPPGRSGPGATVPARTSRSA